MKEAITNAIEGLKALPKANTIPAWLHRKVLSLGIKARKLQSLASVSFVRVTQRSTSTQNSTLSFAVSTTGTSSNMVESSQIQRLVKDLELHNLNGLAYSLGITKEGVIRLTKLLEDVRDTNNGSKLSSEEINTLVKNAVLKERILRQTTIQLDTPPSLMKNESLLTNKLWLANGYGMRAMGEHYAGNVIGVTA